MSWQLVCQIPPWLTLTLQPPCQWSGQGSCVLLGEVLSRKKATTPLPCSLLLYGTGTCKDVPKLSAWLLSISSRKCENHHLPSLSPGTLASSSSMVAAQLSSSVISASNQPPNLSFFCKRSLADYCFKQLPISVESVDELPVLTNLNDKMCDGPASCVRWFVPPQRHRLVVKVDDTLKENCNRWKLNSYPAPSARLAACKGPPPSLAQTKIKILSSW